MVVVVVVGLREGKGTEGQMLCRWCSMSYSARKGPLTLCSVLVGPKMAKKGRIQGCRLFALL